MLKSFFHTGIVVKDLDKSIDFYVNVLGMRLGGRMERQGGYINQVLAFPDAHIKGAFIDVGEGHQLEFIQYINPAGGQSSFNRNDAGATHVAFWVEDIERLCNETAQRGLRLNSQPAAFHDDQGKLTRKAVYCQDPDGNWLEFVETF